MDASNLSDDFEPSVELRRAIEASASLSKWLVAQNRMAIFETDAQRLAITHLAIAQDHRAAFHLLIQHGAFTSALALLRPIYESLTRGTWAYLCATPDQCKQAYTKGVLPKFETIVKHLDKLKGSGGEFGKFRNSAWEPFSDLTHGGMRQVGKWTHPHVIGPNHQDEDLIDAMTMAGMHGLQASLITSMVRGASFREGEALLMSVASGYWMRKGRHPSHD